MPLLDVAAMAAHLPPDSATSREMRGDAWWVTPEIEFLREMEHRLRVLVWQKTEDGSKGRNYPEPHELPGDAPAAETDVIGAWEGFEDSEAARDWYLSRFPEAQV